MKWITHSRSWVPIFDFGITNLTIINKTKTEAKKQKNTKRKKKKKKKKKKPHNTLFLSLSPCLYLCFRSEEVKKEYILYKWIIET